MTGQRGQCDRKRQREPKTDLRLIHAERILKALMFRLFTFSTKKDFKVTKMWTFVVYGGRAVVSPHSVLKLT